jgi:hypothetical protein
MVALRVPLFLCILRARSVSPSIPFHSVKLDVRENERIVPNISPLKEGCLYCLFTKSIY